MPIMGAKQKLSITTFIWTTFAQPKHRFIVWLAIKDRLLTKIRLQKLKVSVDGIQCDLCGVHDAENTQHLFRTVLGLLL